MPGDRLLTALRGKDVLLVFVESYGKSAVEGSSGNIDAVLDAASRELADVAFAARSGWLTSFSNFGGGSAHSSGYLG